MINGLRVAAVTCLHFGADWLPYAMRSVANDVDEFVVCYSPTPNHGTYSSSVLCPESRDMLMNSLFWLDHQDAPTWIEWDGWRSEGEQFWHGYSHSKADVIVKLDADECWQPGLLKSAVEYAIEHQAHEVRLPLRHYWRSMRKAFTNDPAAPGRIYLKQIAKGKEITFNQSNPYVVRLKLHGEPDTVDTSYRIHHFGYCLKPDLMRYKMGIHGHLREFKNPNWFNEVWLANRQTDCHPIGSDYWMVTETVDVPEFLQDHPFANLEIIE